MKQLAYHEIRLADELFSEVRKFKFPNIPDLVSHNRSLKSNLSKCQFNIVENAASKVLHGL